MKNHSQAHIIDLGDALQRSMASPRALTSGSVRHLPGEPSHERRERGPITELVRSDRCGCVGYEGRCDGEPVGIVEIRHGHWTARGTSGALVREGTLVEVLGIQTGDKWHDPVGDDWVLDVIGGNEIVVLSRYRGLILYRVEGPLAVFLADGWRPVAT